VDPYIVINHGTRLINCLFAKNMKSKLPKFANTFLSQYEFLQFLKGWKGRHGVGDITASRKQYMAVSNVTHTLHETLSLHCSSDYYEGCTGAAFYFLH